MTYAYGSRGENVRRIQRLLKIYPDGRFGILTREAVEEFQRKTGLKVDGIVGPATWCRLVGLAIQPKTNRRINEIIIHCTATPAGKDYSVEEIRRMHRLRGFSDIGYHYVISRDGTTNVGRDVAIAGAHCSGHNAHSIGIAYVGGLAKDGKKPADTRTVAQARALERLVLSIKYFYPEAVVKGHRDFSPDKNGNGLIEPSEWVKACPCFDAAKEYAEI